MSNLTKNIRNLLLPASFFIPFTFYFLLFAAGSWWAYYILAQQQSAPGTSFSDIFALLIKIAEWFIGIVTALAIITVLIPFIFFWLQKKRGNTRFTLNTAETSRQKQGNQHLKVHFVISPVLKPLLGFVKLRLKYDGKYSDKFALAERWQRKIISDTLEGDYTWSLPEIKEYHIQRLVLYFEDFFQFFSLKVSIPVTSHFYTPPPPEKSKDFVISPRKTIDTDTRIEELKRVEGEYINYKNFENNDDVRRIVWKIYARNKELVVRIPEILDPYASEAYMYASFFNHFGKTDNGTVDIYFLNYYKTILWAVYQKLQKQGFDIRFVPDQQNHTTTYINEQKAVEYAVATSNWQTEKDIKAYVNMKDASVVVLNSLSDAEQAEALIHSTTGNTWFVLVRLTKSLSSAYIVGLIQWLFVQQERNDLEKYKRGWQFSLLRPKVSRNEKKLADLLAKHEKTIVI